MPIYVRAGAVLPMGPIKQYVTEKVDGPLALRVHPGASGESFLYADDGECYAYEHGDFTRLSLKWDDPPKKLTIALAAGSKKVWPEFSSIEVENAARWRTKASQVRRKAGGLAALKLARSSRH
jgi:alpha-glucosidase (family GH31 glycosyl hydrolase)